MVRAAGTTLIDCRWLGFSGVGRVTSLLLEGLQLLDPPGRWALWGPEAVSAYLWTSSEWVPAEGSPVRSLGHQGAWHLPPAERALFPHLVRPLVPRRRCVVIAHDVIPVRWAEPSWQRPLQRAFYAWSARTAERVIVYSDATARAIQRDLRAPAATIRRVRLPIDLGLPRRASELRRAEAMSPGDVLYVGIDRPHKNLERAMLAFAGSRPQRSGRRFRLVGLQSDRVGPVEAFAERHQIEGVVAEGRCSELELERRFAAAALLIQPALEEGLGLTVIEGLAAGLPVCCTAGTAMEEAACGRAELFDGRSVDSMRAAIDRAWLSGWRTAEQADAFIEAAGIPTPEEFAAGVVRCLDELA
jgi:glycosyltransferase involved in cell wall biosynthesis